MDQVLSGIEVGGSHLVPFGFYGSNVGKQLPAELYAGFGYLVPEALLNHVVNGGVLVRYEI